MASARRPTGPARPCARRLNGRPTVSAITAPRSPIGLAAPVVESIAVWCSISAFSSAPIRTTITENQIQSMKPITAPSEP